MRSELVWENSPVPYIPFWHFFLENVCSFWERVCHNVCCVARRMRACELAGLIFVSEFVPFGNIPSTILDNCIYYSWQFECFIKVAIVFPDFSFESCMPELLNILDGLLILFGWRVTFKVLFQYRLLLLRLHLVYFFFLLNHSNSVSYRFRSNPDVLTYVCSLYLHRIMHLKLHWLCKAPVSRNKFNAP